MTNIAFSTNGNTAFEQLIGHNKYVLEHWLQLETTLFTKTSLDSNLLEQVRRTLAFGNECRYCMAKAGKAAFDKNEKRISFACAFADQFSLGHKSIVALHFDMLKEVFADIEIAELCSFISFISASQMFGSMMNLTEEYQTNKLN
jgi:alkylhydroperoxidase family enzyme